MDNKGFTLLEVLVAIVIFSIVFILLIELESNHIKRFSQNLQKLEALQFFKIKKLGISTDEEKFKIEKRSSYFGNLIISENIISDKNGKEVLTINTYKFTNVNKEDQF